METATSYQSWRQAAAAHDDAAGLNAWRQDDESPHYHAPELRQDINLLYDLLAKKNVAKLLEVLDASLHRHHNDLLEPALYAKAFSGTKLLVSDYLDAVEKVITSLVYTDIPGWSAAAKLAVVRRAYSNLGRSALLFSGGATLGFYHMGVSRALWKAKLLPEVLSGASMGAMVASGLGCRTNDELEELLGPDTPPIDRLGLQRHTLQQIASARSLMDSEHLLSTIRKNCGRYTFQEAFERSGRVLNISVAPTRTRQKPRVLSHLTSPDVWVPIAALASSAVPGLYPPVTLTRKRRDGSTAPYIGAERWIDGSFGEDLPMMRIARLHNVNHFIVSQVQPHVLPVLNSMGRQGVTGVATAAAASWLRAQAVTLASTTRRLTGNTPLGAPMEIAHALATQKYTGHIDIHPPFEPGLYRKLLKNPTEEELGHFVRAGERATWPKLQMIEDHTRLSRCLARCERHLSDEL
jgi:NTE family protein